MKVVFRVDSSTQIGSGHLMRCLTLADGLRDRGADILFLCRDLEGNLNQLVRDNGFEVTLLNTSAAGTGAFLWNHHAAWLEVSQEQDSDECIKVLQNSGCYDLLIVDHYALDSNWESALRSCVDKIMVIDDLADRRHVCDFLLDQNYSEGMAARYDQFVSGHCEQLLGPRYALLRPEFNKLRETTSLPASQISRVLVFYGGSDKTNETGKALEAIAGLEMDDVQFDIVVGGSNPRKNQIENTCVSLRNVNFYCQVSNMAQMMAESDLCLGAGGTATWERCCLGLPTIVTTVAGNQEELTAYCAKQGVLFWLGKAQDVTVADVQSALMLFRSASVNLHHFSYVSSRVVDGNGLQRVVSKIAMDSLDLRESVLADCKNIFKWRNAKETRQMFFDPEPIKYKNHVEWFNMVLESQDRVLLIGEKNDNPVGILRYDISEDLATVSVYLVPGTHQRGLGTKLIKCGSEWLKKNRPSVVKIIAEIKRDNTASRKAFLTAGYQESHSSFEIAIS